MSAGDVSCQTPLEPRTPNEDTPPNDDAPLAAAHRAVAESVLTELELGLTFLDVASATVDRDHARQNVNHAITALRTADKFLSGIQPDTSMLNVIRQRRAELTQRLRALSATSGT